MNDHGSVDYKTDKVVYQGITVVLGESAITNIDCHNYETI